MIMHMYWRRAWSRFFLALLLGLAIVAISPEWPAFGDAKFRFQTIVGRDNRFDFLEWTTAALGNNCLLYTSPSPRD